jgi:hypothetical protein
LQPVINVFVLDSIMALQSLRESYTVFPSSTIIDVRPVLHLNGLSPMLVTELGMLMFVRPVHSEYLQLAICQLVLIKTVEK